jgi:glycerol-3-phosphate acyltransferase PlsY
MSQAWLVIIALVAAYFLGSIPSAYIAGRLKKGIDIRQVGSRNMGAMNSFYNLGPVYGLLVLVADIGKGAATVALARWLVTPDVVLGVPQLVEFMAGVMAVLGHNFPVWLKFKGGKGGATAIGVAIFLMPWCLPIGLVFFLLLLALTRVPTISYGIAMVSFPFVAWLKYDRPDYVIFSVMLMLVPFISYIPRLMEMRRKGGSWKRVFSRKSIKDRL